MRRRLIPWVVLGLAGLGLWVLWPTSPPKGTVATFERSASTAGPTPMPPATPALDSPSSVAPPSQQWPAAPTALRDERPARARKRQVYALSYFADTSRPLDERIAATTQLARRADDDAVTLLRQLGDSSLYLSWAAIRALGRVPNRAHRRSIASYLQSKLDDADSRNAEAAAWALGNLVGEEAVPDLRAALKACRTRADGHGQLVSAEVIETLAAIGGPAARSVLVTELARAESAVPRERWDHEYGSKLVAALKRLDDAASRAARQSYAQLLTRHLPQAPLPRSYVQAKVAEAHVETR
jgi:hypothetical protein